MHRSNVSIVPNNNRNSFEKEDPHLYDPGDQFQSENVLFEMKAINKSYLQSSFFRYNPARIVRKSGGLNLFLKQLQNKRTQYMRDLGNTLLTIRWRWILLTLCLICLRDGSLRLIFRLNDSSGKIWCHTHISVYFIDKSACLNNNLASDFVLKRMKVQPYGLLIFPLEIEHIIDEHSPLWDVEAGDMLQTRFEIVVIAEGNSIVTGQMSQNCTSYTNADIKWGQKFVSCIDEYDNHVMNYMNFKQTVPCYTPLCSARKLREIEAASN